MSDKPQDPVKTTERSIEILKLLQARDGMELEEVTTELEMALSTVHRHLSTLSFHGFVVQSGSEYRIGLRFLDLGNYARESLDSFEVAKEQANTLADETGEGTAHCRGERNERPAVPSDGRPPSADRRPNRETTAPPSPRRREGNPGGETERTYRAYPRPLGGSPRRRKTRSRTATSFSTNSKRSGDEATR